MVLIQYMLANTDHKNLLYVLFNAKVCLYIIVMNSFPKSFAKAKYLSPKFWSLTSRSSCKKLNATACKKISPPHFLFLPQFFYSHHDLTHINPQCPQSLHRLHRLFPSIILSSSTIISSFPPKKFPAKNLFLRYKDILFSTKNESQCLKT